MRTQYRCHYCHCLTTYPVGLSISFKHIETLFLGMPELNVARSHALMHFMSDWAVTGTVRASDIKMELRFSPHGSRYSRESLYRLRAMSGRVNGIDWLCVSDNVCVRVVSIGTMDLIDRTVLKNNHPEKPLQFFKKIMPPGVIKLTCNLLRATLAVRSPHSDPERLRSRECTSAGMYYHNQIQC